MGRGDEIMPRRGENIYKRKDGRWEARFIKEISVDGTKKYGSVYAKTYSEVKQKRQSVLTEIKSIKPTCKITVEFAIGEWLRHIKNQVKITSFQKYSCVVDKHIIPIIGKCEIKYLNSITIQKYTDKLLEQNLSRTTVNDILVVLGMGLSYAKKEYNIAIPKIPLVKNPPKEMRVLSLEEQNVFVKFLLSKNDIFAFGMLLAIFTGLRIGELCALTWEDITDNTITVNKTVQRIRKNNYTEVVILPPKTASSNRVIPIPKELLMLLKAKRSVGNVLVQENGKPVEPRLLQMKFKKYTAECGIENINFHALRHSFATRCVELGFDIKTLSEILGHSDVKTTLNKYVHSSMSQKSKQMDMLKFNIAI